MDDRDTNTKIDLRIIMELLVATVFAVYQHTREMIRIFHNFSKLSNVAHLVKDPFDYIVLVSKSQSKQRLTCGRCQKWPSSLLNNAWTIFSSFLSTHKINVHIEIRAHNLAIFTYCLLPQHINWETLYKPIIWFIGVRKGHSTVEILANRLLFSLMCKGFFITGSMIHKTLVLMYLCPLTSLLTCMWINLTVQQHSCSINVWLIRSHSIS